MSRSYLSAIAFSAAAAVAASASAGTLVNENYALGDSSGWTNVGTSTVGVYATKATSELNANAANILAFDASADQGNFQTATRSLTPSNSVAFADKVFVLNWSVASELASDSGEFYKTVVQITDDNGAGVQLANLFNQNGPATLDQGAPGANQFKGRKATITDGGAPAASDSAGTYAFNGIYGSTIDMPNTLTSGTIRSVEDNTGILGTVFSQEAVIRPDQAAAETMNVEWRALNNIGGSDAVRDVTATGVATTIETTGEADVVQPVTNFTQATIQMTRPALRNAGGLARVVYADGTVYHGDLVDGTINTANQNHHVGFGNFQLVEYHVADIDRDGQVQATDYQPINANLNVLSSGAVWADGDTDNDGAITATDYQKVNANLNVTSLAGVAGTPDLVYDPSTGNLSIDMDGGTLVDFVVRIDNASAVNFNLANVLGADGVGTEIMGQDPQVAAVDAIIDVVNQTYSAKVISESLVNTFPGVLDANLNLGNVLPTSLTPLEFQSLFSQANGTPSFGFGSSPDFDLVYVPEPTSLALLGLGALAAGRRRRA